MPPALRAFSVSCLLCLTALLTACDGKIVSSLDATDPETGQITENQAVETLALRSRDFEFAAQKAVQSFLNSPYARRQGNTAPWIAQVGEVVNDTPLHIDTASMTSRIEIGLMRSGLFMITSATGSRPSKFVGDSRKLADQPMFDQSGTAKDGTVKAPELSIDGVIRQRVVTGTGNRQQVEYEFDFKVVEAASGLNLFRDLVDIQKVGPDDVFAW